MSRIDTGNLTETLPSDLSEEVFEQLIEQGATRIERIVSCGHSSAPGLWYDQDRNEWVLLLRGAARLEFEDGNETVDLAPGSYVNIPAGVRHRVAWTAPNEPTIWLAVWYGKRLEG
ncbi:MAG: cupin domain-containing protein [Desulfobacterales bacterium]|nr:cupin domain-containing protein [Desulfobacterales bacterium]